MRTGKTQITGAGDSRCAFTTTGEMLAPMWDAHTGKAFHGMHRDLRIVAHRNGDKVCVTTAYCADTAGGMYNRKREEHSIGELVAQYKSAAAELGVKFTYVDDVPQGASMPWICRDCGCVFWQARGTDWCCPTCRKQEAA